MKLSQAVAELDLLDEGATICAQKPWTADSECQLVVLKGKPVPEDVKAAGYHYFLEIHVAKEVLEVFGDRKPAAEEKLRLIIHYAEYDAYPDWLD
jgi:hypothetical protein